MQSSHVLTTLKRLSPILLTGLAIVLITLFFVYKTEKGLLTINADVLESASLAHANMATSNDAFLPVPTSYAQTPLALETSVPILMYHYIRDFTDTTDQLGMNLSVSPATFTAQLKAIKQAGYTPITFKDLGKDLPAKPIILTFDDGYADAYSAAFPILKEQRATAVFYIVSGLMNKDRYVTDGQVKEMDTAGMEIGGHTVSHRNLSAMSESAQRAELHDSKTTLEQLIGKTVDAFCYPAGRYNDTTLALAKEIGYTTATTTMPGIATGSDIKRTPYELVRIRVTNTTDVLKALGEKR
jgi:peptidoglycan/xylan/chitin deacetylase (PgdA/CDA1 family)